MSGETDYPAALAIAYLFLVSYCTNRLFVAFKLPGAVGVILVGFLFSFFLQDSIAAARNELQELAFFLVLLTAGFEIALPDLNLGVAVLSSIPAGMEICGSALVARLMFDWDWVECFTLGTCLCSLGDGLVIPKMKAFMQEFPTHPMPRFMFTWGPLEASFVLTVFGILTPLAHPEGEEVQSAATALTANVVILIATTLVGGVLGVLLAKGVQNRTKLILNGRQVFTGATVEAYLMVLSVALFSFGLGQAGHYSGEPVVPLMFAPGSMFQPELLVIVTGCAFGATIDDETLHSIEMTAGGVWVFGQLILYSMLGSKTDLSVFKVIGMVLPVIVVSVFFRFMGVALVYSLVHARMGRPKEAFWKDVVFMFLSTLPRATLQGALSGVPKRKLFFGDMAHAIAARNYIAVAGRIYIVIFAIGGSILVDTIGKSMLQATDHLSVKDAPIQPIGIRSFVGNQNASFDRTNSSRSAVVRDHFNLLEDVRKSTAGLPMSQDNSLEEGNRKTRAHTESPAGRLSDSMEMPISTTRTS